MAADTGGSLRQTLCEIAKAEHTRDYSLGLKAANRLIKKFPKETYAFKCKLVSLIHLSQWDDALTLLKKTPTSQMGNCSFVKAYIHYRMNDNSSALAELENCDQNDVRVVELKAQLFYRLDRYSEACELYMNLLKNHSDENDEERKANMMAVKAQMAGRGEDIDMSGESAETADQLYNSSCFDIEKDNYKAALSKLDKAIPLSAASLAEAGYTEEEAEEEGGSLAVQRAFCLQQLGRQQEAVAIYSRLLQLNPSDLSVRASLLNNLAGTLAVSSNEMRKKIKTALQIDPSKLSRTQRATLLLNQALVLLMSRQREPAKRAVECLVKEFGESEETQLLSACLEWQGGEEEKALSALPSLSPSSVMAKAHFLVNMGRLAEGEKQLQLLPPPLALSPAVISLQATLLHAVGNTDEAARILFEAKRVKKGHISYSSVLSRLADLLLCSGKNAEAVTVLEELLEIRPDDMKVVAELLRAYSVVDPSKAERLREKSRLGQQKGGKELDVEQLEDSDCILYGDKYKLKKDAKSGEAEDAEILTGKMRRRRRKRVVLPKNYDPSVQPDPERWLPKQERTAYKKKNKKNKDRDVGRGTQGASAAAASSFDYNKPAEQSPRMATPAEGPRQQRPAAQANKKKKAKGGKW